MPDFPPHPRTLPRRVAPLGLVLAVAVLVVAALALPDGAADLLAAQTTETAVGAATEGLRTVGGTAPELARATSEQAWRSQAGALLADDDSAWGDLDRDERRLLLDGEVEWVPFDEETAGDPELAEAVFPIAYFAAEIRADDAITTDSLFLNQAVLALPLSELGPVLAVGEPQAALIEPDVVLLVDDVVVGLISDGASEGIDAEPGRVDDFGRIVPGEGGATDPVPTPASAATEAATGVTEAPPLRSTRGEAIPRVPLAELPIEAADTIALIQAGGPFPFERDGITFGNFEGHLPDAQMGYYREYTVITPGLDHRGARRIVMGENGELFYTEDHYESFVEVILPDD